MMFVRYACPRCGGDRVGYDANSVWDEAAQDWVLGSTFDNGWCNDCGDVDPVKQEITDLAEIHELLGARWKRELEPLAPTMLVQLQTTLGELERHQRKLDRPSSTIERLIKDHRALLVQIRSKQLFSARSAAADPPSPTQHGHSAGSVQLCARIG